MRAIKIFSSVALRRIKVLDKIILLQEQKREGKTQLEISRVASIEKGRLIESCYFYFPFYDSLEVFPPSKEIVRAALISK